MESMDYNDWVYSEPNESECYSVLFVFGFCGLSALKIKWISIAQGGLVAVASIAQSFSLSFPRNTQLCQLRRHRLPRQCSEKNDSVAGATFPFCELNPMMRC